MFTQKIIEDAKDIECGKKEEEKKGKTKDW